MFPALIHDKYRRVGRLAHYMRCDGADRDAGSHDEKYPIIAGEDIRRERERAGKIHGFFAARTIFSFIQSPLTGNARLHARPQLGSFFGYRNNSILHVILSRG